MDISDIIVWLVGGAATTRGKKVKPSIGRRLLPAEYRGNTNMVIAANILFWIGIVAVCVVFVAVFGG